MRLERLASYKHSNLMGLFASYDENEVLRMGPLAYKKVRKFMPKEL
jgi:hypothetical protein